MNSNARSCMSAAIVATVALLTAPAAARDKLRIATEGAFAPWSATDPSGKLVGFEVDLAQDLCRRLDADCAIIAQDWDGILPGLHQGRYEAVIAAVTITPERSRVVDFTIAYAADPAIFALRAGSPLAAAFPPIGRVDLAGDPALVQSAVSAIATVLAGRTVAVQTSTIHARMMDVLFPGVTVRAYDKLDHAALDLAAGRVDALLGARTAITAISTREASHVAPIGPEFRGGPLGHGTGIAVRKGDDQLRARLDHAIEQAASDGTTSRLSTKWFGFDVSF